MVSVTARKVTDGLFCISWEAKISLAGFDRTVKINDLTEFSESTGLGSFKLKHSKVLGVKDYLELIAVPTNSASAMTPFKIENSIHIQVSRNGDHDKMMYIGSQTKWIASWKVREPPSACKCFSPNFTICRQCEKTYPFEYCSVFEIMIFNSNDVLCLNRGVTAVLSHLSNLWEKKTLSDVEFKCQGKSIDAHTLIVASGSPVLAALFQNGFKENQEKVVEIVDIKPNVFENLLCYIYTGRTTSLENGELQNDVEELFIAADRYDMESLKDKCAMRLSRDLSVDNVVYFFTLAHHYNSKSLYELTMDFMTTNAEAVVSGCDWSDLKNKYPDLTFKIQQHLISRLANAISGSFS